MCLSTTTQSAISTKIQVEQFTKLCRSTDDKDLIITAMIQATKASVQQIRHIQVIKLLKALRDIHIGTNAVEFGVNKICSIPLMLGG